MRLELVEEQWEGHGATDRIRRVQLAACEPVVFVMLGDQDG